MSEPSDRSARDLHNLVDHFRKGPGPVLCDPDEYDRDEPKTTCCWGRNWNWNWRLPALPAKRLDNELSCEAWVAHVVPVLNDIAAGCLWLRMEMEEKKKVWGGRGVTEDR